MAAKEGGTKKFSLFLLFLLDPDSEIPDPGLNNFRVRDSR
jgi:hypothetical protein